MIKGNAFTAMGEGTRIFCGYKYNKSSIPEQLNCTAQVYCSRRIGLLILWLMGTMLAMPVAASFDFDLPNGDKIQFGGYAKVDLRHVNGDIAYQDYWVGNFPGGAKTDTSHSGFNVRESRFSIKYVHGNVSGYMELDFFGGGGNEVVSNSSNPRLRHLYINYHNWLVGQTWSTFMPLAALPESLDFGGPHVGEVFIRQSMIRYSKDGFQIALENPETSGDGNVGTPASAVGLTGDEADADESLLDLVGRYTFQRDWGEITTAGLVRQVDQSGIDETAIAVNVSGRINAIGKDDFRFQVSAGEPGRYVAAGMTPDVVTDPNNEETVVEKTTAITVAYRHFWAEKLRSTVYYGAAQTDVLERDRSHWAINLLTEIEPGLTVGGEFGEYRIDDKGIDNIASHYLQFSAKFVF